MKVLLSFFILVKTLLVNSTWIKLYHSTFSFPLFIPSIIVWSLYLFVLRPAILLKFTKTKLVANKIISFDLISDASDDQTAKLRLFGSTAPPIPWEPSFCVLREDVKTLTFHKQEEVTSASLCSFICEKNKQKFRVIFLDTWWSLLMYRREQTNCLV